MTEETTGWIYDGTPFTRAMFEKLTGDGVVGFIYNIENTETGEKYIGQKRFFSQRKKPYTTKKGTRRRRTVVRESDWMEYYSSNTLLNEMVAEGRTESLTREILRFGYSKGDLSFLETVEQINCAVLFDPTYLNGIVNCRIHQKHISKRLRKELGYDH